MNLANCPCLTHCRLWEETQGGKYAPSAHAPSCEHYKPEPFTVLEYEGTRSVMEPGDAEQTLADADDRDAYKVSTVMLTRDQYDALPEFTGY